MKRINVKHLEYIWAQSTYSPISSINGIKENLVVERLVRRSGNSPGKYKVRTKRGMFSWVPEIMIILLNKPQKRK